MTDLTTTNHRAAALTTASVLAMWDGAETNADKVRAGAAMAEVLRGKLPKPKVAKTAPDLLTAENLIVTMKRLSAVVERRASIPILAHVLMESCGGMLTLTGTDLDAMYVETLRAPGLPEFKMAAPFSDLTSALVGGKGEITFRDDTIHPKPGETYETWESGKEVTKPREPSHFLTLILGGLEAKFPCFAPDGFPIMQTPHDPDGKAFVPSTATMPSARLLGPLGFVRPAVSMEDTRYYLNGVYMHLTVRQGEPTLTFAATDGSRVLIDRSEGAGGFDLSMPAVILSRKAVDWIIRNVRDNEVQVDIWPQQVRLTTVTGTYLTKVIDGNFPDYTRVIPSDRASTVAACADAKAFTKAIGRLAAHTKSKSGGVNLILKDGKVTGKSRGLEGSMVADLPVEYTGDSKEVGFNGRYLAEMVGLGEPSTIDLHGPNLPALILWPNMPARLGLIMPLRV